MDGAKFSIQIIVGHCLGGVGNDIYPGTVLEVPGDVSPEEARRKLRLGFARLYSPPPQTGPQATPACGPDTVINGDPDLENADPDVELGDPVVDHANRRKRPRR